MGTKARTVAGAAGNSDSAGHDSATMELDVLRTRLAEVTGDLVFNESLTLLEKAARMARELTAQRRAFISMMRNPQVLIATPGQDPRAAKDPRAQAAANVQAIEGMLKAEIGAIFANCDRLNALLNGQAESEPDGEEVAKPELTLANG